ncbi:hypothetical protein ABB37_06107 [Leptomonas pyrrhocoris]|uniref:Uncharacterized protein n=1 Tax=Leptomonas pyrrhocoris TaxID=157538 RepID=A0A0M9FYD5_LEPPY|nr:hypothetical protein ABB37_06107 [Leptomonas pyrrhocoris]KPA78493.1 hypothetical protein ABB37_06107 [Leptomonas pyrrhocoris]|eukprot:XP_015656932.1 hypothetical protein ABB37_06107 [Leptomonas pyrrhocoris]
MNGSFNAHVGGSAGQGTPPMGYSASASPNANMSNSSSGSGGVRFPLNSAISARPTSESELTNDALAHLSELATAALTSPDKETRDGAAQQLLFLSSYEYWDTLRTLLPRAQNNYLRFIIVKAILFLVSNELGPQERTEVQQYVLEYIQERRRSGEELPFYLRNALFSVFASALFGNWKIAIIRAESAEQMNSTEMAEEIFAKLRSYLTTDETLDCVMEILTFFARQNSKHSILSVKGSFAKQVLPFFFSAAADMLSVSPAKAAVVCSTALECAPELEAPLIRIYHPSEASITVLRWPAWAPALSSAMNQCGQALLEQPDGPYAAVLARLLRQCSTVTSPQEEYIASRDEVASVLLDVSQRLLLKVQENPSRTELLRLSCALLVNTFERNDEATVEFLARRPELIRVWADATRYILDQPFSEEEADLYQALLHLFFLIAERLLPPKPRLRNALEEPMESFYGASTPPRSASRERVEERHSQLQSPMSGPRGPLPSDRAREVEQQVVEVFSVYMDLIIDTAHQREDSQELRSGATFVLQTERMLQPIAEVLFCERVDLLPQLVERLHQTMHQYELCVRARREQAAEQGNMGNNSNNSSKSSSGGAGVGNVPGYSAATQSLLQELYITMAMYSMNMGSGLSAMDATTTPLFFTHVCLSRLSVIVSIFGIALLQGTASRDDTVLSSIASFARQLLGQEDQVTEDLLLCLSLFDDPAEGDAGGAAAGGGGDVFGSSAGVPAGPSTVPGGSSGGSGNAQIHIGILRALFFFCGCVYETNLSRNEDFYEITVNLLCYVYRYHSDQVALVADANMLLNRIVDYGSSGTYFLGADKLMGLVDVVKEGQLPLLQTHGPAGAAGLTSEALEARHGFLTAFTFYAETRYYAGFPIADVVNTITERCFRDDRMQVHPRLAFQDLMAITKGIHQPDTLLVMLEALLRHKDVCSAVVRYEVRAAPDMIAWLSVLCSRSRQYLEDQNLSTTSWELTSVGMNVLCLFFSFLSYPTSGSPPPGQVAAAVASFNGQFGGGGGDARCCTDPPVVGGSSGGDGCGASSFFNFPTDAVDASVVYDVADILHTFCTAPWANLGIVLFYERTTLEHFFCGAVELLTTTSVQYLMADEGRARIFDAMAAAVNSTGDTFQQLHVLFMRQGVWNRLVRLVTRCLNYAYAAELVYLLHSILRSDHEARQRIPEYQGLGGYTLAATFNEICTLIAVAPHLTYREMTGCFDILQMCYDGAPILCGECADKLLDFCSAYHRVRLRLIINSLRRGDGEHLMTQYMTYFGQSSVVPVLSAW